MAETRQDRQCRGKVKYIDEAEARDRAKAMHKLYKAEFNQYECRYCGYWHIGQNRSKHAGKARSQRRQG